MDEVEDEELNADEAKERKILRMLLKIKNGTPPQRKTALRQITDKAREFGAGPLFNQILPLLMSPTLEDQERHLLVKVSRFPAVDAKRVEGAVSVFYVFYALRFSIVLRVVHSISVMVLLIVRLVL